MQVCQRIRSLGCRWLRLIGASHNLSPVVKVIQRTLFYSAIMLLTSGCFASWGEVRSVEVTGESCERINVRLDKETNTQEIKPQ